MWPAPCTVALQEMYYGAKKPPLDLSKDGFGILVAPRGGQLQELFRALYILPRKPETTGKTDSFGHVQEAISASFVACL